MKKGVYKIAKKNLKDVFNELEKEELIEILMQICDKDKIIKNKLLFEYVQAVSMTAKQLEKLMDKIIKSYAGRYKFVEYKKMNDFSETLFDVLEKISKNTDVKSKIINILTFLTKAIEAFEYVDDSNGHLGDVVNNALEELFKEVVVAKELDIKDKSEIFNEVLEYTDNKCLDDSSEYKTMIFKYLIELVDNDIMRKKLEDKINVRIEEAAGAVFAKHIIEPLKNILLDIKMRFGNDKEVEEFIKGNMEITSFRKIVVQKLVASGNYNKAIAIICEGEEVDKGYNGLVSEWKKLKYEVYKMAGERDEQFKLAKELYDNWNFEYYHELKMLSKGKEKELYEQLKKEARAKNSKYLYSNRMYRELIVEENDFEAILEVVVNHPSAITEYADKLIGTYKKEVIEIYEFFIKELSDDASERKQYKVICKQIKEFSKYIEIEKKIKFINGLIEKYKRRPAFIDELSKLL